MGLFWRYIQRQYGSQPRLSSRHSIYVLVLGAVFLSACERIPEGEGRSQISRDGALVSKSVELKKHLYACRGVWNRGALPSLSAQDAMLDALQRRGVSSLDANDAKVFFGPALLWDASGTLLFVGPSLDDAIEIECATEPQVYFKAKRLGSDRSLGLSVLKIDPISSRTWTRWPARPNLVDADEPVFAVSLIAPSQVIRYESRAQSRPLLVLSGFDQDLIGLVPNPSELFQSSFLFDREWRWVGVLSSLSPSQMGLGISAARVEASVKSIQTFGRVRRPYLGLRLRGQEGKKGLVVHQVEIGSPAYQGGIRAQDVLLSWDSKELRSFKDWVEPEVSQIGKSISALIQRGDKSISLAVQIAEQD